jgi:hypothetical protein
MNESRRIDDWHDAVVRIDHVHVALFSIAAVDAFSSRNANSRRKSRLNSAARCLFLSIAVSTGKAGTAVGRPLSSTAIIVK